MPNFDGTGPQGAGPRTGRRIGTCQQNPRSRGLFARFRRGVGFRHAGRFNRPFGGGDRSANRE